MKYVNLGYQICIRSWKKLLYRPIHLVFSFIQPIFWLTIFGFLFEKNFPIENGSYLSYLLPGVCAMTVLQSAAQSGILYIKDFQTGFFGRYHFTPASKFLSLFFKIFADYVRIVFQIAILYLIGLIIGVPSIHFTFQGILLILAATFLFTYFYASLSCLIAIKTKTSELMATFIQLFNLPIIFTSTALVPNKNLPSWLETIAKYNPLSNLSSILRNNSIEIHIETVSDLQSILIILALFLLFFTITYFSLRKINYS